ncbi:2OG-Fe(II) oxygenase [Verrucomicrobium spinosum]|uniref:2OG-Fe(II) oxygenase n=1 Tax=Verrucomicrobium spinosum TaxID=2736 RepID=UPI0009464E63|nr:2OG-Fe(II) oxygenase [Verrucomicrobium spinosum]
MREIFAKLAEAEVHLEPFPHVIIEDVLDAQTCAALLREMPPMEVLTRGEAPRSNHRFSLSAATALEDPRVSAVWKELMREGISQEFLQAVIQKFSSHIRREHPHFETSFGPLENLEVIHRRHKDRPIHAVGLDVQIAVNTPALSPGTTVRGGHIDKPDKIFTGLLYLRHQEDESTGADLEFHEILPGEVVFGRSYSLPGSRVRTVRTVPYRNNTLVLFLNTPRSVHGVTARSIAAWPRYHINIVGEMREPVFTVKLDSTVEPPPSSASAPPPRLKMEPLFARCVGVGPLEPHPFPMVVLEKALPESLYRELELALPKCLKESAMMRIFEPGLNANHYPMGKTATLQHSLPDNTKAARTARDLLADPELPQVWRDFIEANLSQEALSACLQRFGAAILQEYPDFERRFGPLSSLRARRRGIDPAGPGDVELDVLVGAQTAVAGEACAQRGAHLKKNNKVIECYLYFRPDEDDGQDGAHEFFAIKEPGSLTFGAGWQVDRDKVKVARSVPSRGNTMVAWVNTARSIQQVAPRNPTPFALPFVELLVQLPEPLFEVDRLPALVDGGVPEEAMGTQQPPDKDTQFKSGWHSPERDGGGLFQWMGPGTPSVIEVPWLIRRGRGCFSSTSAMP